MSSGRIGALGALPGAGGAGGAVLGIGGAVGSRLRRLLTELSGDGGADRRHRIDSVESALPARCDLALAAGRPDALEPQSLGVALEALVVPFSALGALSVHVSVAC